MRIGFPFPSFGTFRNWPGNLPSRFGVHGGLGGFGSFGSGFPFGGEVEEPKNTDTPTFEDFWLLWPRHVAKKNANKAWMRLTLEQCVAAIVGLVEWRRVWAFEAQKREDFYDFIPYPATWLNGERWEDEIPDRHKLRQQTVAAVFTAQPMRTVPMPEHIRQLLVKLRSSTAH